MNINNLISPAYLSKDTEINNKENNRVSLSS